MTDATRRSVHWLHLSERTCLGFLGVGCPSRPGAFQTACTASFLPRPGAFQTACTASFLLFPQDSDRINLGDFSDLALQDASVGLSARYVVMYDGKKSELQVICSRARTVMNTEQNFTEPAPYLLLLQKPAGHCQTVPSKLNETIYAEFTERLWCETGSC